MKMRQGKDLKEKKKKAGGDTFKALTAVAASVA